MWEKPSDPSLPAHLGGHYFMTNSDAGALDSLIRYYKPRSFLDIGCGPAGMVKLAQSRGLSAVGIDGDHTLDFGGAPVWVHDFASGPLRPQSCFDLGWSVEFLEHVEQRHLDNLRPAFQCCKRVWVTHAVPGQHGHHHVNCQPRAYWVAVFNAWGFALSENRTQAVRNASTMKQPYARRTGLLFERHE